MRTYRTKNKARLPAMLLAIVLTMSLLPLNVLAANVQERAQTGETTQQEEAAHTITVADVETGITLSVGELYTIDLSEVFTDSEGHTLRYSLSGGSFNSQVGITDAGIFKFTSPSAGDFTPKIKAVCTDNIRFSALLELSITVTDGDEYENPAQYGYDETSADSVAVTVTISNDGIPLMGRDGTVLSHLTVDVPYFDLAEYGLEGYYRYHTKGGKGSYADGNVVERPTAMHLFIYLLERYYLGIPEEQCGTGTSDLLSYNGTDDVFYFDGNKAYTSQFQALMYTGSATSTYMKNFWGHDENLMYYRNHVYPLMSKGWGATSDYMLLSDGDTVDLAMFSNWSFYNGGAFCCFNQESYTVGTGTTLGFTTRASSSNAFGSNVLSPITGLNVRIYDEEWQLLDELESDTAGFQYTFNKPGTYHLMGVDPNAGTEEACKAPATAVVTVTDSFSDYPFSSVRTADGQLLPNIELHTDVPNMGRYHISVPTGTEQVIITWKDDAQISESYAAYGLDGSGYVENAGTLTVTDHSVTVHPADWAEGSSALVLKDADGNPLGAFTFEFYTPSDVNFAPALAAGVSAAKNAKVREKKAYTVDLSKIFSDPENDSMTYEVSVDGGEFTAAEQNFTYTWEEPGSAALVFRATDSKGAVSTDTYTVNLTVFQNSFPGYVDAENTAKQDTAIEGHLTELELTAVFSDPDGDTMSWEVSVNGGDFVKVKDEELRNWRRWILTDINTGSGYYEQHYNYRYRPETGVNVLRFRSSDDLGFSDDVIYTWTVTATANHAPVAQQELLSLEGMVNHPWYFDISSIFTDPDGDAMTYTVSVDGGEAESTSADYMLPVAETTGIRTLVFTATDEAEVSTSATVELNIKEEQVYDLSVTDNVITPTRNGSITGVATGGGVAYIDAFTVSDEVIVQSVKYSEFGDTYVYYITLDGTGVSRNTSLTTKMTGSGDAAVGFATGNETWRGGVDSFSVTLKDGSADYTGRFRWECGREWGVYRYCRFVFTMAEDNGATPEKLLVTTEKKPVLYVGQHPGTLGVSVKCLYSDGVIRNKVNNDITVSPQQMTETGEQTFTVGAVGLTAEVNVRVCELPSWMGILNWTEGEKGGLSSIAVVDENSEPIEGAKIVIGETIENPDADPDDLTMTFGGGKGNMTNTAIRVQLPEGTAKDAVVGLRFDYFNLLNDSRIFVTSSTNSASQGAWNCRSAVHTTTLSDGRGSAAVYYYTGLPSVWHNGYDQFNISYIVGDNSLSGTVSAWDGEDNLSLLLYPDSMSEEDIRTDVRQDRTGALDVGFTVGAAQADGKHYIRSFTAEGLEAGVYKLAVYKPGKYVVSVSAVTISGETDAGSMVLWLLGDVNNDGRVNSTDAAQIKRYTAGKRDFTAEALLAADVNGEGKINSTDAAQICRYTAGKTSSFDKIS